MKHLLYLLLMFSAFNIQAQDVKVVETFDELDQYAFNRSNDTTYVINFWATWCAPCVKELPYFEALNEKYRGKAFKQILVTLDSPKKVSSRVVPFLKENNIASEVVLLADGKANKWIDRVDPTWSGAIPITIIYKGKERAFYETEFHNLEELEIEFLKIYNK